MLISKIFIDYLEFIKSTKSDGTYRFDVSHARTIQTTLQKLNIRKVSDLNRNKMYLLSNYWKERGVCGSTIHKRFSLLKRALNYSGLYVNGVSDFPSIKFKTKGFKVIPHDDLLKLFSYFWLMPHDGPGLTRLLVFYILFYTGVRSNELIHIRVSLIDLVTCSIQLDFTKTGHSRVVFFDQSLVPLIEEYISMDQNRDLLFKEFRYKKQFSNQKASNILRYASKKLNIARVHPHMLRHTFATMMINNGCPLVALQYILGHSNPRQTEQYLHLGQSYLKKEFELYKPKI